jgi:hypothetical protein
MNGHRVLSHVGPVESVRYPAMRRIAAICASIASRRATCFNGFLFDGQDKRAEFLVELA